MFKILRYVNILLLLLKTRHQVTLGNKWFSYPMLYNNRSRYSTFSYYNSFSVRHRRFNMNYNTFLFFSCYEKCNYGTTKSNNQIKRLKEQTNKFSSANICWFRLSLLFQWIFISFISESVSFHYNFHSKMFSILHHFIPSSLNSSANIFSHL